MNYRFSLDDNIEVFKDLAQYSYESLFDQKYLGFLRRLHERFLSKIQLNIYYETDGFNLSQMPDRYRDYFSAVFQDYNQYPSLTLHDNVSVASSNRADDVIH